MTTITTIIGIVLSIAGLTFWIALLILLPMTFFKKTKAYGGIGLLWSSMIFGIATWLISAFLTYIHWGMLGLIMALLIFGVGVFPAALLATAINTDWPNFFSVLTWFITIWVARFGGMYCLSKTIDNEKEAL